MGKLGNASALALVSSFLWAIWSMLIDIVDSLGKGNYVSYMTIAETSTLVLAAMALFAYPAITKKRLAKADIGWVGYAVTTGLLFGIGTAVFYGLLGGRNYPFVASVQMSALIPFAFIINWVKKEPISRRYIIGTIIAFLGFLLQIFALYGTDISSSYLVVALAFGVMAIWTMGYYLSLVILDRGVQPVTSTPVVSAFSVVAVLAYGALTNGYAAYRSVTAEEALIAVLIGAIAVAAWMAEDYAFFVIRAARAKYMGIINILTNFELVWITLFTAFFLSLAYAPLIGGLIMNLIGIAVVASS